MKSNIGYEMDWGRIDECIDDTTSYFLNYDDMSDEFGWGDRLRDHTVPCKNVWSYLDNGAMATSLVMG